MYLEQIETNMPNMNVYVSDELLDQIEKERGDLSRSGWVKQAIKEKLDQPGHDQRLDELEQRLELLRLEATHSRVSGFSGQPYDSWEELEQRHTDGPPGPF